MVRRSCDLSIVIWLVNDMPGSRVLCNTYQKHCLLPTGNFHPPVSSLASQSGHTLTHQHCSQGTRAPATQQSQHLPSLSTRDISARPTPSCMCLSCASQDAELCTMLSHMKCQLIHLPHNDSENVSSHWQLSLGNKNHSHLKATTERNGTCLDAHHQMTGY